MHRVDINMNQSSFDFALTDFEQATADTLICFKISKKEGESEIDLNARVEAKLNSDSFKNEVRALVQRWNKARVKSGLFPFK